MIRSGFALFLMLVPVVPVVRAAEPTFDSSAKPFLDAHCSGCHAGNEPKGGFRVEALTGDLAQASTRAAWNQAREKIESGAMPPKAKPRPDAKDVSALTGWLASAETQRRAKYGRTPLRRLNRVEFERTIRDLLGITIDLQELLPPDASADGFDNAAAALHVSPFLLEKYLDAVERSLDRAIANGPRPPLVKKRYSLADERIVKVTTESVYRKRETDLVMFSSSPWNSITVGQFYPPDRGRYRIRISASGVQSGGKPVTYRVDAGPMLMATKNHLVDYFDAKSDEATVVEFEDFFEARDHIRIHPYGLANAQTVTKTGAEKYEGPGLAVQWVEVEGPLHDGWPPESHRRIFGEMERKPAPVYNDSRRVEVASSNPEADAERILLGFARRAFRRPVTAADLKTPLALVKAKLAAKQSFEKAVRVGLAAVLVSPDFLFLREAPGRLDDHALACRLSYFLWSSMPDAELFAAADSGTLAQPAELRKQVERMLNHPKAAAFAENFVGQWLGLRDIDFTEPSFLLYPEYDAMLRASMVREAELFFQEIWKHDLSLTNFVASDFAMLNGRLAKHYGIPGVDGYAFRKVALPPGSHRGGVLTMAAVLKVTANGTSTSPVMRGAWVQDRILGSPPPKPPPNIAAIEPDIRGATTIREQLAKHRSIASCAACHNDIDPPGFALESFDVIGGWRTQYRTTGNGDRKDVIIDGRRMPFRMGLKVDPTGELADGSTFADIDAFKGLLLKDKDRLARALVGKVLTYATGAAPDANDRLEIEAIVGRLHEKGYGFRSLAHEVVQSELFRRK
jgi:Protein of unknown function (DUF1592)/Protein of unknown function (DUF1588)/Protein of unknown function (DUF1587)/Protein of unknown function (DUF1585)/Protein of unknown function (DUF1595)/Planctomycete cytochrome C